jgi:hypothetical protein
MSKERQQKGIRKATETQQKDNRTQQQGNRKAAESMPKQVPLFFAKNYRRQKG